MTWTIDRAYTEVTFAVRHLMVSAVRGRFERFDAVVALDTEHPERSTVRATVDAASLNTGNAERDEHLRSSDFLDVAHFPEITFVSTQVAQVGIDSVWVRGDLTIHGVTREVTLRGQIQGPVDDHTGQRVLGFELTAEVDRRDFGIDWDLPLQSGGAFVGYTVTIVIDAELRDSEEPAPSPASHARGEG